MGTRNVVAVYVDGEYKVAQYGQWDGYPSGQGVDALKFLLEIGAKGLPKLADKCRKVQALTPEEAKARWLEVGVTIDECDGWVTMDKSDAHKAKWPELSRDVGAGVLKLIYDAEDGIKLQHNLGFIADGLFCEWAYVIDLERGFFEVYQGFQKQPLTETDRFFSLQKEGCEYYPAKLYRSFSLDSLPTADEFINACKDEGDE